MHYSPISGVWTITNKATDKGNVQGRTTYGTADRTAYELIEDALNLKSTCLFGGNTLLAHEVGAGKSATRS